MDNAHAEIGAGVPEPNGPFRINRADQPGTHQAKFANLPVVIGLGLLGTCVILAAVIMTVVLLVKR